MATIYTIGHSTRALDEFVTVLNAHGIRTLVDIRAFPNSRRLPHFRGPVEHPRWGPAEVEPLERTLPRAGIEYVWMKALGGRRGKPLPDSPHVALRSESFRSYADYMLTLEFQDAAARLVEMASAQPTAIMCAERLWFQCHRMMVSDYLVAHGHDVLHIDSAGPARPHRLTAEGRLVEGRLLYVGDRLF